MFTPEADQSTHLSAAQSETVSGCCDHILQMCDDWLWLSFAGRRCFRELFVDTIYPAVWVEG